VTPLRILALLLAVSALAPLASAPARGAARPACRPVVLHGVLPVWARSGFSAREPRLPHTIGRAGKIAALVFGYPLSSPRLERRRNKILWVSRAPTRPLADLRISAQRMVGTRLAGPAVARTVQGGPGPSIVDLPGAGCWRLTLRWSGHVDSLDLAYVRPG
jgi:hypothetical protein